MLPPEFEVKSVKPTEEEFHRIIQEFWFEIYHTGIYLKRGDLWSVKFRSWAACSFLLQMMEWNAQAKTHWQFSSPSNGKRMPSWVEKYTWQDLQGIFAHFDASDSWKALFKLMELFKRVTAETAHLLAFTSQDDLSAHIIQFIIKLKSTDHFFDETL